MDEEHKRTENDVVLGFGKGAAFVLAAYFVIKVFGVALDDPPDGYTLANPEDVKAVTACLLAGEALRIEGEAPWLDDAELPRDEAAELCIRVTTVAVEGDAATLVYHPRCLALGVGCERDAEPEELWGVTLQTLSEAGVSPRAVGGVFSIDLKSA